MRAARFWVAVDVQTSGLSIGLGARVLGLRVSCKRAAKGVHTRPARVGLACALHTLGTCAYPHVCSSILGRGGCANIIGLGLGLGLRILGLRVSCKRAANGVHTRPARAGLACTLHILGTCA